MNFEFGHKKSAANKIKHGIDFMEGQAIRLISIRAAREEERELYEG